MNKLEVQKRVLKDGKPLPLEDFTWCEKTRTFSSNVDELVLDFGDVHNCTFNTGSFCTFNTFNVCTFNTGIECAFETGWGCTFHTCNGCTFVINGYEFPQAPLRFNGSRYFVEVSGPDTVRSGCINKPISWWLENIRRCAEEHDYTPEQVDEYEVYIQMCDMWLKKFGGKIKKVEDRKD